MKKLLKAFALCAMSIFALAACTSSDPNCTGGWEKVGNAPVLGGGELGTVFDVSVLKTDNGYAMYSSWRPKKAIAVSYSKDGKVWSYPKIVLEGLSNSDWESNVNRPFVMKKDGVWHMWYTGKHKKATGIGYAISTDGENFTRVSSNPVLAAKEKYEGVAVMCPHVLWDDSEKIFKMWYSCGEVYEPNHIAYATSKDGINWKRYDKNPIFAGDPANKWEKERATACQVIKRENDYLMFYIGFEDVHTAKIGMARSKDGISNWERFPDNPIIRPTPNGWDRDACYKPFAIFDGRDWLLWYNGRIHSEKIERIGLAIHNGDLDW